MSAADRLDRSIAADRKARGVANADAIDEATLQAQVVELAHMVGWRTNHVRRTRGRGGAWTTSTSVTGWPDLTLWHPERGFMFVELKSQKGQLRPEQADVLASLEAAGVEVHVWRPSDWAAIQARLTGRAA